MRYTRQPRCIIRARWLRDVGEGGSYTSYDHGTFEAHWDVGEWEEATSLVRRFEALRYSVGSVIGYSFYAPYKIDSSMEVFTAYLRSVNLDITGSDASEAFTASNVRDRIDMGAGDDTIRGGGGNDRIDGGAGADHMYGGTRNDTFYVDDAGDRVFEWKDQGHDEVISTVTFDLAGQYIEELTLRGTAAIDGSGNDLANAVRGNAGSNTLMGRGGVDNIAPGPDSVRDVILYEDASDSTASAFDKIYGFRSGASAGDQTSDKIDLSAFDLTFVETFTNTGRGEVRFSDAGAHVNVVVDLDGNGSTDMLIQVRNHAALHEWDLLL